MGWLVNGKAHFSDAMSGLRACLVFGLCLRGDEKAYGRTVTGILGNNTLAALTAAPITGDAAVDLRRRRERLAWLIV
jgi:hypothetical protein